MNYRLGLELTANKSGLSAAVKGAGDEIKGLGTAGKTAGSQIDAGMKKGQASAQSFERQIASLKSQFLGFLGVAAATQALVGVGKMADSYASLSARLKLAIGDNGNFAASQACVFEAAQHTSTVLESTNNLTARLSKTFSKMGQDAEGAFSSALGIATTINQAFAISGTSAENASAAVNQLNQAFSKGYLNGDEFVSVFENAPGIVDALSVSLGKTTAELRAMSEAGELTSARVISALQQQAAGIDKTFNDLPLTIGRAWQQIENAALQYVGTADQASGASNTFALALKSIADNFEPIANGLITLATLGGTYFAVFVASPAIFAAASAALVAYRLEVGAVAAAQALGIVTARTWQSTLAGAAQVAFTAFAAYQLGTYLRNEFQIVADAGAYMVYGVSQAWANLKFSTQTAFYSVAQTIQNSVTAARASIADLLDGFVDLANVELGSIGGVDFRADFTYGASDKLQSVANAFRSAGVSSETYRENLSAVAGEHESVSAANDAMLADMLSANQAFEGSAAATTVAAAGAGKFEGAIEKVGAAASAGVTALAELKAIGIALNDTYSGPGADAMRTYAAELANIEALRAKAAAVPSLAAEAQTRAVEAQAAALGVLNAALLGVDTAQTAVNAQIEAAERAVSGYLGETQLAIAAIDQSTASGQIRAAGVKAETEFQELLNAALAAGSEEYKAMGVVQQESLKLQAGNAERAAKAQQLITEATEEAASQYNQLWGQATRGVSDAFGDFVTGGIKSFGDFGKALKSIARRFLSDLVSQFAQTNIVGPLMQQLQGVASGGAGGGIGSLLGGFGSLLGLGGTSAAGVTTAAGSAGAGGILGSVSGLFGGVSTALTGLVGTGGALGGFSAALGIAGRAGIGAATSYGVSSIAAGSFAQGLGALIPVVGQIFSVASIVNSLTGGRLFGGKKEAVGGGIDVNLGPNGASGNQFTNFEQRRSLFRGTRRTTTTSALSDETQETVDQLAAASVAIVNAALGGLTQTLPNAVTGAYKQIVDKTGKVTGETITVLGVQYSEGLKELPIRVGAENIFAGLTEITGTSLESFASQYRATADSLLDAANAAAGAQRLIASGAGLLKEGDLLSTLGLVSELRNEGETLTSALTRVYASAQLLTQATTLAGISLGKSESDFVRFAAGITEAAGGLDAAAGLWQTYFDTFYTETERASSALASAEQSRAAALKAIGLDATISAAQFRTAFETALPSLKPEEVVQWLRASTAISGANAAQAAYNRTLEATAAALADAIGVLSDVEQSLDDSFRTLERDGLTDFQRQMLAINDQTEETVASLTAQRAAAARAGASSAQLARFDLALGRAHMLAAAQAAAAIRTLVAAGRTLVTQLGLSRAQALAGILRPREEPASTGGGGGDGGAGEVQEATDNLFESWIRGIESVQEYLDRQLLSETSSLTPAERMAEIQRQFDETLRLAQGGDADALGRITDLADILLREARAFSPASFRVVEASIRDSLRGLTTLTFGTPTGVGGSGGGGGGGGGGSSTGTGTPEQAAGIDRQALAELTGVMRDLLSANLTLDEVIDSLGLDLNAYVEAMGVNLEDMTGVTGAALAEIAGQLGIELSELATSVGLTLGSLADDQSLLNDSLEEAIGTLPDLQANSLQPLLDAVEAAADDPAGLATARAALVAEIVQIGGTTADLLGPFFDEINPTDPLDDIYGALGLGFGDVEAAIGDTTSAVLGSANTVAGAIGELAGSLSFAINALGTALQPPPPVTPPVTPPPPPPPPPPPAPPPTPEGVSGNASLLNTLNLGFSALESAVRESSLELVTATEDNAYEVTRQQRISSNERVRGARS